MLEAFWRCTDNTSFSDIVNLWQNNWCDVFIGQNNRNADGVVQRLVYKNI